MSSWKKSIRSILIVKDKQINIQDITRASDNNDFYF